jgi:hypothetical protein
MAAEVANRLNTQKSRSVSQTPHQLNSRFFGAGNQSIKNNKLCKTNPISGNPKTNLNYYIANDYERKSGPLMMQKQTQTKPIQTQNKPNSKPIQIQTKPKQTQSKPIYSACPAKPRCVGRSREQSRTYFTCLRLAGG